VLKAFSRSRFDIRGIGINRMISMSNTKNTTAKRKYRVENGSRAVFLGSNPHSKGEDFSRSWVKRVGIAETANAREIKIIGRSKEIKERVKEVIIAICRFIDELNIFC